MIFLLSFPLFTNLPCTPPLPTIFAIPLIPRHNFFVSPSKSLLALGTTPSQISFRFFFTIPRTCFLSFIPLPIIYQLIAHHVLLMHLFPLFCCFSQLAISIKWRTGRTTPNQLLTNHVLRRYIHCASLEWVPFAPLSRNPQPNTPLDVAVHTMHASLREFMRSRSPRSCPGNDLTRCFFLGRTTASHQQHEASTWRWSTGINTYMNFCGYCSLVLMKGAFLYDGPNTAPQHHHQPYI